MRPRSSSQLQKLIEEMRGAHRLHRHSGRCKVIYHRFHDARSIRRQLPVEVFFRRVDDVGEQGGLSRNGPKPLCSR